MKALSFFSGALGLDLGIEKAGFDIKLACEVDPVMQQTIKLNRPDLNLIGDIFNYSGSDIRKSAGLKYNENIDLVFGGPPCQAFSTAGKRNSFAENRGLVSFKYLELIKELSPRYFILENVRGLLSVPLSSGKDRGGTLCLILKYLKEAGYNCSFNLYNSMYFGTAQSRERLIIIGCKKNKVPHLMPTHSNDPKYNLNKIKTFKNICKNLKAKEGTFLPIPEKRLKFYKILKAGENWKNLPLNLQKEAMGKSYYLGGGKTGFYRRLDWNKPSPAVLTNPLMPATDLVHPVENRSLSINEYKKIQDFPIKWKLSGTLLQQYKQIGNAVPVNLGYAVGLAIRKHLYGEKSNTSKDFKYSRYKNTCEMSFNDQKLSPDKS
jgi:DNA (cytosine-5)-methyltransferase 1